MSDTENALLSLPPELRNRIYDLVLDQRQYVKVKLNNTRPYSCMRASCIPGITQVNRQTRSEALPMYRGRATLHFNIAIRDRPKPVELVTAMLAAVPHIEQIKIIELSLCRHLNHYRLDVTDLPASFQLSAIVREYRGSDCIVNEETPRVAQEGFGESVRAAGRDAGLDGGAVGALVSGILSYWTY